MLLFIERRGNLSRLMLFGSLCLIHNSTHGEEFVCHSGKEGDDIISRPLQLD